MGPQAVPELAEAVIDKQVSAAARSRAAEALIRFGPEAKAAIPALQTVLVDESIVAEQAGMALQAMGPLAVPGLIELLQAQDAKIRARTASLLGGMPIHAGPAVKHLVKALQDPDAAVRFEAADALGEIGLTDAKVRSAVAALEKDPDRKVQALARLLLLLADDKARSSAEPVVRRYHTSLLDTVEELVDDQGRFQPVDRRFDTLWDYYPLNESVREAKKGDWRHIQIMGALRSRARLGTAVLLVALHSNDAIQRANAAQLLRGRTEHAAEIVPALEFALSDPEPDCRWRAINTLSTLGPAAKATLPRLKEMSAKDPVDFVRWEALLIRWLLAHDRAAAEALLGELRKGQPGPDKAKEAPALVAAFLDVLKNGKDSADFDTRTRRVVAAHALGGFGKEAKGALGPLLETWNEREFKWPETKKSWTYAEFDRVRLWWGAAGAIVSIGRETGDLAALRSLLQSHSGVALQAVREMGRDAEPALPVVKRLLGGSLTREAAQCIVAIAPPEQALPPLTAILRSTVTPPKKEERGQPDVWTHTHRPTCSWA